MASNRLTLAMHALLVSIRGIRLADPDGNGNTDTLHPSSASRESEQGEAWDLMGEEGHLRIQQLRRAGRSRGRILGSWSWDG